MILDNVSLIAIETIFVVVSGLFLILYASKLHSIITQERVAGEIVSSIVTSLERKIQEKDDRISDLLFRVDLLETKMISSTGKQSRIESVTSQSYGTTLSHTTSSGITSTEITALRLLLNESRTPKEIQKGLGKSREHVTRLMKDLFERGFVSRNQNQRPFVYNLTNTGKDLVIGLK